MRARTILIPLRPEIKTMYDRLKLALLEAEDQADNILEQAERSVAIAAAAIEALRLYVQGNSFATEEEEIYFFKEVKPLFHSELLYFAKLSRMELRIPTGSISSQKKFYNRLLFGLHLDFENNQDFYEYYRSGHTYLDERYFLRKMPGGAPLFHAAYADADPSFSTGYDYKVSKLIASERLSIYLNTKMQLLDVIHDIPERPFLSDDQQLTWKAQVIQLVELIYALYAFAPFENPLINVAMLARFFSAVFHIKIDKIHKKMEEIRMRKKNRTVFIDQLRASLMRQMEEDDLKSPTK